MSNSNLLFFPSLTCDCPYCGYSGSVDEVQDCCDEAQAGGFEEE